MGQVIVATRSNSLPIINEDMMPLILGTGLVGFCLGGYKGALTAARRFALECMHCPPKSRSEISLFSRQRNNTILGGFISEGAKFSVKFMIISISFNLINSSIRSFSPYHNVILNDSISAGIVGGVMSLTGSVPKFYYVRRGILLGSIAGLSLGLIRVSY